jgi:hypothetical protein
MLCQRWSCVLLLTPKLIRFVDTETETQGQRKLQNNNRTSSYRGHPRGNIQYCAQSLLEAGVLKMSIFLDIWGRDTKTHQNNMFLFYDALLFMYRF